MTNLALLFLSNIHRTLSKKKFLSFLLILELSLCLFMTSVVFSQKTKVDESVKDYNDNYGTKPFYMIREGMDDIRYYDVTHNTKQNEIKKLKDFYDGLLESESFEFSTVCMQPIEIYDEVIPDIFLNQYDNGNASASINKNKDQTTYFTNAIQVSQHFFDSFPIIMDEGTVFSDSDYKLTIQSEIPVLLGNAYKEKFSVGDKISAMYHGVECNLYVKGFLDKSAFFYGCSAKDMVSCERYIVMPTVNAMDYAPDIDARIALQYFSGYIKSDKGYTQIEKEFNELKEKNDIDVDDVYISNPESQEFGINSVLEKYSKITNSVKKQFHIIFIFILIFTIISMTMTVNGFLKENHYTYGIQLLNGASFKHIIFDIIGLVGILVILGDLLAMYILIISTFDFSGTIIMHLVAFLIWCITSLMTISYIRRLNISDIIGGKE